MLQRLRAGMDVADSRYPDLSAGVCSQVSRHFDCLAISTLD
jgi:hypothetical protein